MPITTSTPLLSCPDELLSHINTFLPSHDKMCLRMVNRRFRDLMPLEKLIEELLIDFSKYQGILTPEKINQLREKLKTRTISVHSLTIDRYDINSLLTIQKVCPTLKRLRILLSERRQQSPQNFNLWMSEVSRMTFLQELTLDSHFSNHPSITMDFCTKLVQLTALKVLNIACRRLTTDIVFELIKKLKSLQSLDLSFCINTDKQIRTISNPTDIFQETNLKILILIDSAFILTISPYLHHMSSLEKLSLGSTTGHHHGLFNLILPCNSLKNLELHQYNLNDHSFQILLSSTFDLTSLTLIQPFDLTQKSYSMLGQNLQQLAILRIMCANEIGSELAYFHSITELDLFGCTLLSEAFPILGSLSQLKSLDLGGSSFSEISPEDANRFDQPRKMTETAWKHLRKLQHLESLSFAQNKLVTNTALTTHLQLRNMKKLTSLDLWECTQVDERCLSEITSLKKLQILRCSFFPSHTTCKLLENLQELREFQCQTQREAHPLDDKDADMIINSLPQLKRLILHPRVLPTSSFLTFMRARLGKGFKLGPNSIETLQITIPSSFPPLEERL